MADLDRSNITVLGRAGRRRVSLPRGPRLVYLGALTFVAAAIVVALLSGGRYLGYALAATAGVATGALCLLARGFAAARRTHAERLGAARAALAEETRRRRQAEEGTRISERVKAEFLAVMSHEIRTPLNGVIGMAGLLLRDELSDRQRHYVEVVRDSGQALLGLLNEILEFADSEARRSDPEIADFDLLRTLDEVHDLLTARAREKGLGLRREIASEVPAKLRGDIERMRQVLVHLVDNAIKFTDRGEVVTAVDLVEETRSGATLRFEVKDCGIGIEDHVRQKLFEPFAQADSSPARRFGGAGLGLAIARRLVGILGGEIGVDSEVGRGSTFWFTLDLARRPGRPEETRTAEIALAPHHATEGGATAAARSPGHHASDHVLVVEDNSVSQTVTVRQLEILGYRADVAGNGREAIELIRRVAYGAVLMDCQMPVMDGFEATVEIRALEAGARSTPIIALTANALASDRRRALDAGMDDFLTKPVTLEQLGKVLRRWCRLPAETPSTAPDTASRTGPRRTDEAHP